MSRRPIEREEKQSLRIADIQPSPIKGGDLLAFSLASVFSAYCAMSTRCVSRAKSLIGRKGGNGAVGTDLALVEEEESIEVVLGHAAGNDQLNGREHACVQLSFAALDRDGVVVEHAGQDVRADVLNRPLLVVGRQYVEVHLSIAVRRLFACVRVVDATLFLSSLQQHRVKEPLVPTAIKRVRVLPNGDSAVEVDDPVLADAGVSGSGELGVAGDLVPATLHPVLVEAGLSGEILVRAAAPVGTRLHAAEQQGQTGHKWQCSHLS